jgi:hypothetical protein
MPDMGDMWEILGRYEEKEIWDTPKNKGAV